MFSCKYPAIYDSTLIILGISEISFLKLPIGKYMRMSNLNFDLQLGHHQHEEINPMDSEKWMEGKCSRMISRWEMSLEKWTKGLPSECGRYHSLHPTISFFKGYQGF